MKIQKVDGLYRKPRLKPSTPLPLWLWLPLICVLVAPLSYLSLATYLLDQNNFVGLSLSRKHAYRVVAVGDIACSPYDANFNEGYGVADACQQKDVAEAVEREHADAVILLGDIQYDTGDFMEFERSFIPYWRDVKTKMYITAGNHDYGNGQRPAGTADYQRALDLYFPHATYQEAGKPYYDFGFGSWRFYALDSNCEYVGGCGEGSDQYNWLTRQVNVDENACTLVYWHHPVITSGLHRDEPSVSRARALWRALHDAGADIVLSGHDHHYERFGKLNAEGQPAEDGMRQFVVGTGGASWRPVKPPLAAGSQKVVDDSFGYLYLELYPGRYTWQFKTPLGDILDSGEDTCR